MRAAERPAWWWVFVVGATVAGVSALGGTTYLSVADGPAGCPETPPSV